MICKAQDLTGQVFGRLTVLKRVSNNKHGQSRWLCKCQCGVETVVIAGALKSGNTQSCGCLNKDVITKHGLWVSERELYNVYRSMRNRCYNIKQQNYERYGGRGIYVCSEWLSNPCKFVTWAKENGFKKGLQIDRIDSSGPYSPDNCRFITGKENSRNRRNTIKLGKWDCLSRLCEKLGIDVLVDGKTTKKYSRLRWFITKHGSLSENLLKVGGLEV